MGFRFGSFGKETRGIIMRDFEIQGRFVEKIVKMITEIIANNPDEKNPIRKALENYQELCSRKIGKPSIFHSMFLHRSSMPLSSEEAIADFLAVEEVLEVVKESDAIMNTQVAELTMREPKKVATLCFLICEDTLLVSELYEI